MINIITSKTRGRMFRNRADASKIRDEISHMCKDKGVHELIVRKPKPLQQVYKEVKELLPGASDKIQEESERKIKERQKVIKDGQKKRMNEAPQRYFEMQKQRKIKNVK